MPFAGKPIAPSCHEPTGFPSKHFCETKRARPKSVKVRVHNTWPLVIEQNHSRRVDIPPSCIGYAHARSRCFAAQTETNLSQGRTKSWSEAAEELHQNNGTQSAGATRFWPHSQPWLRTHGRALVRQRSSRAGLPRNKAETSIYQYMNTHTHSHVYMYVRMYVCHTYIHTYIYICILYT